MTQFRFCVIFVFSWVHSNRYACRDFGWQQRYARFCGRLVVLSILSLLLYPFLWAWTVIGTLWFRSSMDCVSWCSLFLADSWYVNKLNNGLMHLFACSCLKRDRNGVFLFGCFLFIVHYFAFHACRLGRLVELFCTCSFIRINPELVLFLFMSLIAPLSSGWHEDRHTYYVLNKGFLYQNMG